MITTFDNFTFSKAFSWKVGISQLARVGLVIWLIFTSGVEIWTLFDLLSFVYIYQTVWLKMKSTFVPHWVRQWNLSVDFTWQNISYGDPHGLCNIRRLNKKTIAIIFQWTCYKLPGTPLLTWWVSNHMPSKVGNEIICPFLSSNGATIEGWEWMSNFIPHFKIDVYQLSMPRFDVITMLSLRCVFYWLFMFYWAPV